MGILETATSLMTTASIASSASDDDLEFISLTLASSSTATAATNNMPDIHIYIDNQAKSYVESMSVEELKLYAAQLEKKEMQFQSESGYQLVKTKDVDTKKHYRL